MSLNPFIVSPVPPPTRLLGGELKSTVIMLLVMEQTPQYRSLVTSLLSPPTLLSGMKTLDMVSGQLVNPDDPAAIVESVWNEFASVEGCQHTPQ